MSEPWRQLLDRALDGDELSQGEARALAHALGQAKASCAVGAELRFEGELRGYLAPPGQVALSRERLLAKAALREKGRQVASGARRRRVAWVGAAAAAVALIAVGGALWLGRGRYPRPRARGDLRVVRAGRDVAAAGTLERGDQLVAGRGGATLSLGGYCTLSLDPGAALRLAGEARKEAVELTSGKLVSRVEPKQGEYRVLTPLGTLEVTGTEFVTTVGHRAHAQGGREMSRLKKAAVVTVMVLSGAVAYQFGDATGLLSAGMGQAFGAEGERDEPRLPEGIRGFRGIFVGTVVKVGDRVFVLKVAQVKREWKQSKAASPESVVGKSVTISVWRKSRMLERHLRTLRTLRPGDRVEVEVFHFDGHTLGVVELLRKLEPEGERRREGEGEHDARHEEGERREGERRGDRDGERREREGGERRRDGDREGERAPEEDMAPRDRDRERGVRHEEGERRERREGERREGEREGRREGRRDGEERRERHRDGEGRREGEREGDERGERRRRDGEREGDRDRRRDGEGEGERVSAERLAGYRGLRAVLVGTIEAKGRTSFLLGVLRVSKVVRSNQAKRPESVVGQEIRLTLKWKGRVNSRLAKALAKLEVGDRVEVGAIHLERQHFAAVEVLKKVE